MTSTTVLCYNNQVETGLLCGFLFKQLNTCYNFLDARYLFCAASAGLDPEQLAGVIALIRKGGNMNEKIAERGGYD